MRLEWYGGARDTVEEPLGGGLVVSQAKIRLRDEVQRDGRIVGIEPHRDRERLQRLGQTARIRQRQSGRGRPGQSWDRAR